MFTGLVEEIGTLRRLDPLPGGETRLLLHGPLAASDAQLGDSIAVAGVCLTVVELPGEGCFVVEAIPETMRRSTLGGAAPGDRVNLERSVRADQRLGGHVVQGHVDGTAAVTRRLDGGRWRELTLALDPGHHRLAPLIAEKGAITLDGVSLTVTAVTADTLSVALIPETLRATTLGDLAVGDRVNVEIDVMARYAARWHEGARAQEAAR